MKGIHPVAKRKPWKSCRPSGSIRIGRSNFTRATSSPSIRCPSAGTDLRRWIEPDEVIQDAGMVFENLRFERRQLRDGNPLGEFRVITADDIGKLSVLQIEVKRVGDDPTAR